VTEAIVIPVSLGSRSYEVRIADGALDDAAAQLGPWLRGRATIVTDDAVAAAQLPRLAAALDAAGIPVDPIVLPAGEATKSWAHLAALADALLEKGIERGDHVIALGGGVIGDLVGFAAAILKRGCGFIQIPTTLLAQVDSSVGGKTAINTNAGKNLVGAFHQPALVLIDPTVLDTLPARQVAAGYAEVVKYGLIDRPDFFAWCEANGAALLAGDPAARRHAIATSVAAKAAIVADDERETSGRRALLNLGHTFGHALEAEAGFSDRLLHGEAVAAGMALAFRYSVRLGLCAADDAERVAAHLRSAGLPDGLAAAGIAADGATVTAHMAHDKKASGGKVPFLLARGIGRTFLEKSVDLADVADFLDEEQAHTQPLPQAGGE
jgi:3-dehydroquinate synthase